jgi:hypothetical protein
MFAVLFTLTPEELLKLCDCKTQEEYNDANEWTRKLAWTRDKLRQRTIVGKYPSTALFIAHCFSLSFSQLEELCTYCEIPSTLWRTNRNKTKELLRRLVLEYIMSPIIAHLDTITPATRTSTVQPGPPTSTVAATTVTVTVAVVGMFWLRQPNNSQGKRGLHHPDTVRMDQLQKLFGQGVELLAVGLNSEGSAVAGKKDPRQLSLDIRERRSWYSGVSSNDTIVSRGVFLILVDYFWLPPSYYRNGEKQGLGYGGKWFSHHLPVFFAQGGGVVIFGNDHDGVLLALLQLSSTLEASSVLLTVEEARKIHPLYMATEAVTTISNDDGTSQLTGVYTEHAHKTNKYVTAEYLNVQHPFVLVYNPNMFSCAQAALTRLGNMMAQA